MQTSVRGDLPVDFDNNVFGPFATPPLAVFTVDSMTVEGDTVGEVEALVGSAASGNFATNCPLSDDFRHLSGSPCVNVGSPAGAPVRNREGQLRDVLPDIGPDELVP
jgi:hypothetical protein